MQNNTDLYYDHANRELYKVVDGNRQELTLDEAKSRVQFNNFRDCNMAFHTLASHEWDMDAVEDHYQELDKYK